MPFPSGIQEQMEKIWNPTHFLRRIAPRLRDAGVSDPQIDALLLDNPRRFFAGEAL
jgi:phosphotriesterase-related protein